MKGSRSFRRTGGHINLMEEAIEAADDWGEESWTVDCVCGVNFDDGEEMVNCDDCGVWVHTRCSRYVKGEDLFTCDNCKKPQNAKFQTGRIQNPVNCNNSSEETEVAQFLVELPTKAIKLENSPSSAASARRQFRLWAEIPMEDRVHVQGIPGGDPSLFNGMGSSIFTPALWKCTGYVPKKFSFVYKEFPCWDDDIAAGVKEGSKIDSSLSSLPLENEIVGVKDAFKSEVDGSGLRFGMKKERSLLRSAVLQRGKRKKYDSIFDNHQNSHKRVKNADKMITKRGGSPGEAFASSGGNLNAQAPDEIVPRNSTLNDMKNSKKNDSRDSGKCSVDSVSDDVSAEAEKGVSDVNGVSNEDSFDYHRIPKVSDECKAGGNVTNLNNEVTMSSHNASTSLHEHRSGDNEQEVALVQGFKISSSDAKLSNSLGDYSVFTYPNVKKETEKEALVALTIKPPTKLEDPAKLVGPEGPSDFSFNEPCGLEKGNDGAMVLEEASSSSFATSNCLDPSLGKRSEESSRKHFVCSHNCNPQSSYSMDTYKVIKNKSTVRREKPPSIANASSSIVASAALSDEELALLLHQELNSSPRVPRVPRVRNSSGFPQLRSPGLKRSSVSWGSDHHPISRRKDDTCRRFDVGVKVGARDDVAYSTANSEPSSSTEVDDSRQSSSLNSSRDPSDEDACGPSPRTLPVLLEEILSKGKRMTYEELCNAVFPHWNNLRKHNGERYAYSSPSHAVLDCLRHRQEWAQLVDRGPKARRTKEGEESDEDGLWHSKDDMKSLEECPKGKRNARKRKMAPQGVGHDSNKRQKSGALSEDDSCGLSEKHLSGEGSEGTEPSVCSDDECI